MEENPRAREEGRGGEMGNGISERNHQPHQDALKNFGRGRTNEDPDSKRKKGSAG